MNIILNLFGKQTIQYQDWTFRNVFINMYITTLTKTLSLLMFRGYLRREWLSPLILQYFDKMTWYWSLFWGHKFLSWGWNCLMTQCSFKLVYNSRTIISLTEFNKDVLVLIKSDFLEVFAGEYFDWLLVPVFRYILCFEEWFEISSLEWCYKLSYFSQICLFWFVFQSLDLKRIISSKERQYNYCNGINFQIIEHIKYSFNP